MKARLKVLLVLLSILMPGSAVAHALDPGYLELVPLKQDQWRVFWRVPNVAGRPMPLSARLPDNCEATQPPPPTFDGRAWVTGWLATCPGGLHDGTITIEGLERTSTETLVRYELTPGEPQTRRLTPGESAFKVPADAGTFDIVASYVALGMTHILEGVDHLLFVFALLLLIGDRKRLFWAVTSFTVAHSITLAAASLGVVNVPQPPVEAVIALSIVFLAYELTLSPGDRDGVAIRYPWIVAFAFGLIHGLGFAGALREIGLPEGDIPLALFSFNVGVELGQLGFIAVVIGIGMAARMSWPRIAQTDGMCPAGYVIGSVAAFWVISRLAAF